MLCDERKRKRQHGSFQLHQLGKVFDKPHFQVDARILVDVARGVVLFRTEHGRDLVDALQNADHRLLVELRTLRQKRRRSEKTEYLRLACG